MEWSTLRRVDVDWCLPPPHKMHSCVPFPGTSPNLFCSSGGLDYLVLNHAGGTGGIKVFEGNMETLISSMTINFLSYGQMTVSALNMLNESNGNIIVMSSICGMVGLSL